MNFHVLVTAPRLGQAGARLLESEGCVVHYLRDANNAAEVELLMAREPVDAVISRTVALSARAIRSCPTLKVISKHGVGVSNIDVAAATAQGVPVYVTPGANATSVAELALGLMLSAARRIAYLDAEVRAGRWTRAQDGLQLSGRRLGLVGFGQIGQRLATFAHAMGMEVHAHDPRLGDAGPDARTTMHAGLDSLLVVSDVLSLHVPLTVRTRSLIGARELDLLPAGALLVNTARGEVVDESALVSRLQSGRIAAAGLDTMAQEPLPAGHPLSQLPNVVLTPHVGGSTPAALEAMARDSASNVLGYLQGCPPAAASCVNYEVFSLPTTA